MKIDYKKKYSKVADFYDSYVTADYDIDFWIKECKKEKEVLELTAGSGRVTIPLAKSGVKVTAVDISKELIRVLRNKCKKEKLIVDIHEAGMRKFSLKRKFPLIIVPVHSGAS